MIGPNSTKHLTFGPRWAVVVPPLALPYVDLGGRHRESRRMELQSVMTGAEGHLADYLADLEKHPVLLPKEMVSLWPLASAGCPVARKRLILSGARLVVSVAKGYGWAARRYPGRGCEIDDLIGWGNLGLIRAVDLFDSSRGVRFSTYAYLHIKRLMRLVVKAAAEANIGPLSTAVEASAVHRRLAIADLLESKGARYRKDRTALPRRGGPLCRSAPSWGIFQRGPWWEAHAKLDGRMVCLGNRFATRDEAEEAREKAQAEAKVRADVPA